jgi:hypothetical protein
MRCKHCGTEFPEERAELGYDYCTDQACVDACLKPLNVVAVHVNKASDQYVLREQLGLPEHKSTRTIDPGWAPLFAPPAQRPRTRARSRTTVEVINELEAELDAALASETDPKRRNKLVNDYNAQLRRFDIRYRRIRQRHPS